MKKTELRALLQNIDKETAASVSFDEFLDMASPKVSPRGRREGEERAGMASHPCLAVWHCFVHHVLT